MGLAIALTESAFTESVLWNDVVRCDGTDKILCIPCFVIRADAAGYYHGFLQAGVLT